MLRVPRKLRVQYPVAIYHGMSRGDRREDIFLGDVDRQDFLKTLAEACEKTGWQVHAYCLMSNHFHLVLETPNANLVEGMKWLLGAYTIRLNQRHKRFEAQRERRRLEAVDPEALKTLRRGWCYGSPEFRTRMLQLMEGAIGENHWPEQRRETAAAKAERIIREVVKELGCTEEELRSRRKCDPQKLALAARLRQETTLTVKIIAARLNLGTPRNATVRLQEWKRQQRPTEPMAPAQPGL